MARLRAARAAARELAWAQVLETRRSLPATMVLGQASPGFVLDIDATIVAAHSEKESAAATWKHTFGYHPLLCFLDATGEALGHDPNADVRMRGTPRRTRTTRRCRRCAAPSQQLITAARSTSTQPTAFRRVPPMIIPVFR